MTPTRHDLPKFFWRHSKRGVGKAPFCEIAQVEVTLSQEGWLGHVGDVVYLPLEEMILPAVLHYQVWQPEVCEFLAERAATLVSPVLLDIGANCGLITRQMLAAAPNLQAAICVEPDPNNFACLQRNLRASPNVHAFNFGLSDTGGKLNFYKEFTNCGNFSFNPAAVRGTEHEVTHADTLAVPGFFANVSAQLDDQPLLWKSDTQGFDELIVANTPWDIWDRVSAAVIEIWRIEKPDFDATEFARKIEAFPNKVLDGQPVQTATEVLQYLNSDDRMHCDLWLWH